MRIRNVKNKDEIINNCSYLIKEPKPKYFDNDNPIHLEIGMGKGNFIINMAIKHPNINFIGVEKYDSVIAKAIEKINNYDLDNLLVLREDAYNLEKYFSGKIDTIYLNFSDPWPKKRHARRRLTSGYFLNIYDKLYKSAGTLIQKTDNLTLLESSIINLNNHGYIFKEISLDLSNTELPNIKTEYEEKFIKKGIKINYIYAYKEEHKVLK